MLLPFEASAVFFWNHCLCSRFPLLGWPRSYKVHNSTLEWFTILCLNISPLLTSTHHKLHMQLIKTVIHEKENIKRCTSDNCLGKQLLKPCCIFASEFLNLNIVLWFNLQLFFIAVWQFKWAGPQISYYDLFAISCLVVYI